MLKIFRGALANLPLTLDEGRLAFVNDAGAEQIYIGGIASNLVRIGMFADITTAINALKDSVPTNLDTLNKLAQAIANDPNFYSTINTAIATKASTTQLSLVQGNVASLQADKADTTYVDAQLALKASQSYTDTQLSSKADLSYTNNELSLKYSADSLKADTTIVNIAGTVNGIALMSPWYIDPTNLSRWKSRILAYGTNGSGVYFNLPDLNASMDIGYQIEIMKQSSSSIYITPFSGQTINGSSSSITLNTICKLIKINSSEWRGINL